MSRTLPVKGLTKLPEQSTCGTSDSQKRFWVSISARDLSEVIEDKHFKLHEGGRQHVWESRIQYDATTVIVVCWNVDTLGTLP